MGRSSPSGLSVLVYGGSGHPEVVTLLSKFGPEPAVLRADQPDSETGQPRGGGSKQRDAEPGLWLGRGVLQ